MVFLQRHLHVLGHGQRREQRAVLEQHAGVALDLQALLGVCRDSASTPSTSICPPCGRRRPRIARISTDLPVPEPPTTPMISPGVHVQVEVLVHDLLAEAVAQAAHADGEFGAAAASRAATALTSPSP